MTKILTPAADWSALVGPLEAAALAAGHVIMNYYAAGVSVTHKPDQSPVTEADQAAEAIILDALKRITPKIPIIAEEEVAAGRIPELTDKWFYLVDPLDGTKEFLLRNGDFTVNIALIEAGVPLLGVVYAPVRGLLFTGSPNGAEEMEIDGAGAIKSRRSIQARNCPANPVNVIAVASRSHATPETEIYLADSGVETCVSVGSSLKFCLLARGEADLYPRFSRTMEWDTAAGDAVLRSAGGATCTLDGKPLTYGKRNQPDDSDFANPHFIACGAEAIK